MTPEPNHTSSSLLDRMVDACIRQRVVVLVLVAVLVGWGLRVAPFDWDLGGLPRDPVAVDAIPDIGENQQIVFTRWPGRSPQDVEDQISYPLTASLLGMPGVKTVRSFSMFGFSSIYVIFEEDVEFYWSRSRILEKLNSLPPNALPPGVQPSLGPDATALGQVFWYTLEGRDESGRPAGGWDPQELRSIQDWQVRYALMAADGVSEVASVGGFVQEYQVEVDPDALLAYDLRLEDVFNAVRMSNLDVGARTIELNQAEYVIRGVGFIRELGDIEDSVIQSRDNVPILVRHVAHVTRGPALRRGVLDKGGAEAVGGVVVVRHGENPLAAIQSVKAKIEEIAAGLPSKTLDDGTTSKVTIVPFYDRTELIEETLGTLSHALSNEILITIVVVLVMVMHLRSSLLVSALLPLAVLMSFIAMKQFGVEANIVALSGIAIAIGTMVDMGIVVTENILRHLDRAGPKTRMFDVVSKATREVASAVLTATATTIVSFLPVFTMTGAEGKLFRPLAFTKTFALLAAVLIALFVIPAIAQILFRRRSAAPQAATAGWSGDLPGNLSRKFSGRWVNAVIAVIVLVLLSRFWEPLGPERGLIGNFAFVLVVIGSLLLALMALQRAYGPILEWALRNKGAFLAIPIAVMALGTWVWVGFDAFFGWLPTSVRTTPLVSTVAHAFPGLGKEFMPPLDEGSFLFMPTTMPHASIGEAYDVLRKQDMAIESIPEVRTAVGKIGRVDSALDPAPVSMIETVINYHPEYLEDAHGKRLRFRFDADAEETVRDLNGREVWAPDGQPYLARGAFERDANGELIPDSKGRPFRLWRPPLDPKLNPDRTAWEGIQDPDDIWDQILEVTRIPGTTSAPRLQPIAARIVMLQSGMRAPLGIQVRGPNQETIEAFGLELERELKKVPSVQANAVVADRIVGKPYLEIHIDRQAIARHGIHLAKVQDVIETAIGGKTVTRTVEGRARYDVRVRYPRELRDDIGSIERVLVAAPDGSQIPLRQLAEIRYVRGPQVIKSEDTFLLGYVIFDKKDGYAEVDVVEHARDYLASRIEDGHIVVPAGVSYEFTGSYKNQVRAQKTLAVILPLALALVFLILYLQFQSVTLTGLVFSGIAVSWAGGFLLLWLYGQGWFLDVPFFGVDLRQLFDIRPLNLSVAVWVGFIALFGIATDNGVIIGTYLDQTFRRAGPKSVDEIRKAALEAGRRRIRPCLMATATTLLALLPVLSSTGRGSDVMVPMAIPSFGGMVFVILTTFMVPVLYSLFAEMRFRNGGASGSR